MAVDPHTSQDIRFSLIKLSLAVLLFGGLCIVVVLSMLEPGQTRLSITPKAFSAVTMGSFALLGVVRVIKRGSKKVQLTPTGFVHPEIFDGEIPWSAFERVSARKIKREARLHVWLNDEYHHSIKDRLPFMFSVGGEDGYPLGHFTISATPLSMSFDGLQGAVATYLAAHNPSAVFDESAES